VTYDRDFKGKAAIAAVQYGKEGEYWLKKFSGELQKTCFPYDSNIKSQPQRQTNHNIAFEIKTSNASKLVELSKGLDYRLYIILTAGLAALLYKYTGNKDIVIGSPIFKQDKDGNFINTMLPLRNPIDGAMTFKELLLDQVRPTIIEANEHQNYPIETLLFQLNMPVTPGEFPLFDVVVLLENIHEKKYIHSVHPNVIFSFSRIADAIEGKVEYNPALYRPDTIDSIIYHFKRLLEKVAVNINMSISEIDILGEEEKKHILYDFNGGNQQLRYPHHKTLHRLFAEQVQRTPGYMALVGMSLGVGTRFIASAAGKQYVHLTYNELNEKSDRLAHLLIEMGVKPDTIVGIILERSIEMIIGILGILKAGGAYLPIDPDYPKDRINYMLADSGAKIVLTSDAINRVPTPNHLPMHLSTLSSSSTLTSTCKVSSASLAYVIYTSGTTGKPKGSLIEHRNVVSLMLHDHYLFDFGSNDVWTMFHSYCFDFSVWEMYGALLYGGKLVLISKMTARDPQQYLQILEAEKVTILNQTPAAFYQLAQQELDRPGRNLRLKYVIFGGEALTPAKLKPWKEKYPGTKLINMFGITETTVHVTYKEILHTDIKLNISNIGGPLPTLNIYIIDRHRKQLPIGVPGELFVSGAGVCRGYLNQPQLTAEKFIKKFLPGGPGGAVFSKRVPPGRRRQKSYRSGDLTRWLPDGNIEYLGRIDHQVKIRGYRVELGEIEAQLMRHCAVKEAAALEWEDPDGFKALNAYVVPDPQYAYPVKKLTELERAGGLENKLYHEYPNGMTIFYINRHETDFMYREIFEERSYIQHGITLEEGACIFDVGANIGMFSLFVRHACRNAKIYAFEPIPPIFEVLSLNTSIYCGSVEVFPCGLSQKESEAVFTYYPHATVLSGRFADRSQETETVKAYIKNEPGENTREDRLSEGQINELLEDRLKSTSFTCKMKSLSQIIRENAIEKIDLLKIDVEKAEIDVLNGIDETDWPKIHQLVIEVHDVDKGLEEIIQQLRRRGYRVVVQQDSELKNTNLYNVYAISEAKYISGTQPPAVLKKKTRDDPGYYLSPGRFIDHLRTFLKEKVPGYMVPSYFVLMEHIPLNPSGKVDRKALPAPEVKTGTGYIAPGNRIEVKLAEIWAWVLKIEKDAIGIDSDFFQLGGHSLKATIFISKLHQVLNVKIPLAVLFKTPRIRELAQYIAGLKSNPFVGLGAVEKKEYYPLSSAQKRLYVLQQMELDSTAYNVPQVYIPEGELNEKALENTFRQLINRHESLRTSFDIIKGKPVQKIHQEVKFEFDYYDISKFESEVKVEEEWSSRFEGTGGLAPLPIEPAAALISSFIRPFDLSQAPLLRVGLIPLHTPPFGHPSQEGKVEDKHILMIDMHHIITDGTSMDLFVKESMALYVGEELPSLKFQYKDYSQWQHSPQQKKAVRKQEEYWLKKFSDDPPVLNLPLDYPRPGVQSFEGAVLSFEVSGVLTQSINQMALDTGATLFMVLLAIYNIFLSKLSGQEDIVVGTPIAARRHADLGRIIGMFVNTLASRNYPIHEKTVLEFIEEVKESTLQIFENQEYQFEDLVEKVSVHRDPGRNPIFDTMFALQNMETQADEIPGANISSLTITPYQFESKKTKFDLHLACLEEEKKLVCWFGYGTKLFKKETIERFIAYFKQILSTVLTDSNRKILQIEIMTAEEKRQILYDFNDTMAVYPRQKTIQQLFTHQVEQRPDNIAIVGPLQSKNRTYMTYMSYISYRKLDEESNQLACYLIEKGVTPDTIVGIMPDRSLEMIVGILGILKAGGAYLPIDPGYPRERIDYMLADSAAKLLLTPDAINRVPTLTSTCKVSPTNLAYIIYTSGTSGKPKAVMIEHKNVVKLVKNTNYIDLSEGERLLITGSITFDITTFEIWGPLLNGLSIYMTEGNAIADPEKLKEIIVANRISILHLIPQLFNQMAAANLEIFAPLKFFLVGGDLVKPWYVNRLRNKYPDLNILHMYGPTENTTFSTFLPVDRRHENNIPIGKPVSNSSVYILGKGNELLPGGAVGELCIGGEGIARGYMNRPETTAEKFNHDLWDYHDYHAEKKNYKLQITKKVNHELTRIYTNSFLSISVLCQLYIIITIHVFNRIMSKLYR